ncbi:MAG: hypothetical protein ACRD9L_22295 [Bryobacteraceae bacterium]
MALLKLTLTDAAGNDLNDQITVDLFSQQSSKQYQASQRIARNIQIDGIDIAGGPLYRVMVTPANHRTIQFFLMLSEGKTSVFSAPAPVDPGKVVSISAPVFDRLPVKARQMLNEAQIPLFNDGAGGYLQGLPLYAALDRYPLLKACYLNIVSKSAQTNLPDNQTCIDHYAGLVRIEQDRLFLRTKAALVEETAHSNSFHQVSAALHDPLPGYSIMSSFKTFDRYGNLQLTFQRRGATGDDYAVDVDIDDAQGVEHLFQVLRNSVNGPTNPYDIHDILLQQAPPVVAGYEFVFASVAATV